MILEAITLTNFKNFIGEHKFIFSNINLVKGKNGKGKSTLVLDSLLFVIYGYYRNSLDSLPTRGKSKTCKVWIKLRLNKDYYEIERSYPTNIKILKNNEEITLTNNEEKQNFLNQIFKNVEYFRKFRMIDVKEGINLLEEGKTSLRKSLISFSQDYFNTIRQKLLDKKREREIYNKDKAILYTHYPSENRLTVVETGIAEHQAKIANIDNSMDAENRNIIEIDRLVSGNESKINLFQSQADKLVDYDSCPTCKRLLSEEDKQSILNQFNKDIEELQNEINYQLARKTPYTIAINIYKEDREKLLKQKDRLYQLKLKLESRIKQKDYKWTNRDIEIIKKSVEELDKFFSWYITNSIKNLEPIINNVTNKIGIHLDFKLDAKGNFDLSLTKDGETFNYKDLSDGQKLILSMAFQIALLLNNQDEGLIVADEGFGSLDIDNLNMVFDLFKDLPFQLICILHRLDNVPEIVNTIDL